MIMARRQLFVVRAGHRIDETSLSADYPAPGSTNKAYKSPTLCEYSSLRLSGQHFCILVSAQGLANPAEFFSGSFSNKKCCHTKPVLNGPLPFLHGSVFILTFPFDANSRELRKFEEDCLMGSFVV